MTTASDPTASALRSVLDDLSSPGARRAYTVDWERYIGWCAANKTSPLKASPKTIREHVNWMKDDQKLARSTIGKAISVIREVYRALVNDEVIETNPARETKTPKVDGTPKTSWMTAEEIKKLVDAMPNSTWHDRRDRLVIRSMISLGWRRAEIARMCAEHIDGNSITVTVKGNKSTVVGVPARLLAELKEWCRYAGIEDGPLFPRSQDKLDKPITGAIIYDIVHKAGARVGLDKISPHSFRRSMLTYLRGRGVDGAELQAAVNHSSFGTTEKYFKANKAAEKAPGELMLEMLDGEEEKP